MVHGCDPHTVFFKFGNYVPPHASLTGLMSVSGIKRDCPIKWSLWPRRYLPHHRVLSQTSASSTEQSPYFRFGLFIFMQVVAALLLPLPYQHIYQRDCYCFVSSVGSRNSSTLPLCLELKAGIFDPLLTCTIPVVVLCARVAVAMSLITALNRVSTCAWQCESTSVAARCLPSGGL